MILETLRGFHDRTTRVIESMVAGRLASAKITLFALAVGLFCSFPNHYGLSDEAAGVSWAGVLEKSRDPFLDMTTKYGPSVHESKLNFRLTVPIAANILGLNRKGILVLHAASAVMLLWSAARVFLRDTSDPVAALFMTVLVASTWAGITGFVEYRGMFDVEALLFLTCALLAQGPMLAGLFAFLAAWTDERGLIASSLVYLYHVYRHYDNGRGDRLSAFVSPTAIGVVLSWAAYFATRFALARAYHISTPVDGTGLGTFIGQINNFPMGCWTALEGGWLLVFAAVYVLWHQRQLAFLTAFGLSIAILITVAMSVFDITRSMAYILPAVFVAVQVLRKVETPADLRVLCIFAAVIALLWPNYYAEYGNHIWWSTPLPLRIMKWLTT
jgi:hypothetical protein